jgi:hypothetical protein
LQERETYLKLLLFFYCLWLMVIWRSLNNDYDWKENVYLCTYAKCICCEASPSVQFYGFSLCYKDTK